MASTDPAELTGSGSSTPAWRENGGLLLSLVLLWVVYFHGWSGRLDLHWQRLAWFGINFLVLFVVPALVIKFVFHQRLADYGVRLGEPRIWGRYLLGFAALMIPVIILASRLPSLRDYYPMYEYARIGRFPGASAGWFALSSLGWLVYFFSWEFFFRGWMLNLLLPRYGGIAIVVQTIPFTLMHFPKPEAEAISAIVAGVALGIMAYRGKSMIGTWLLHWGVAFLMDLLVVVWR
jgi:membrane protease YdiL (CAAX protease family)